MASWMAELVGSDRGSSINRVRMRTTAPRSCIHEHQLQLLTHRPPDSRRYGRLNALTQCIEQPENQLP